MQHIPPLRGVPPGKILEARRLSDGTWIFKIANKKGPGDFRVSVLDPVTHTRLTPTYAHFAIDLYGKLCQNESLTASLLELVEEVYRGHPASEILKKLSTTELSTNLAKLHGYSVEYTLHTLEFIFAQEDVNWERDFIQPRRPLPALRHKLVEQGFLTRDEAYNRGSAIAMHLFRRVVRDKVHVVTAMHEVRLRI